MRVRGAALLASAVAVTAAAASAWASDKRDFEACDGRVHPGKQADGLRGAADTGLFGSVPYYGGGGVVDACTRALASPQLLPTQTLRRAHLLRARAAAHLRAGRHAEGAADLDAAEAATVDLANDRFHQRSMGVSLRLLRAVARAQAGDLPGATALAEAAVAARPYSLEVQRVAASVLHAAREPGVRTASPWAAMTRLDPGAGATAMIREAEAGDFAGVLALAPGVPVQWPTEHVKAGDLPKREQGTTRLLSAVIVSLHTAYARAATGDAQGARRDVATVRERMAALRPAAGAEPSADLAAALAAGLDKYVDARARQVEARIAVAEKRHADAIAALLASPMPRDAASAELLAALKAVTPAKDAGLVPDTVSFGPGEDDRRELLVRAVPAALIAPETPRAVVDYSRARPNILGALVGAAVSMGTSLLGGIDRTDGFRSTNNPDGTVKVEFIGNTPSATLVQEMTLLRAAEVARAAGKRGFVIVDRHDYARRMVMTRGGSPVSSTPTGFKTELTIRAVDDVAGTPRALDATAVIDALGPLYYEEKRAAA